MHYFFEREEFSRGTLHLAKVISESDAYSVIGGGETLTAFNQSNLLDKVGFKDLGAGGIACASVEIAEVAGYGARVKLDEVPVSMENLATPVYIGKYGTTYAKGLIDEVRIYNKVLSSTEISNKELF